MSYSSTLAQLIARYCSTLHRHRWLILVGVGFLVISAATGALFLERTADNRVFFGENNPQFQAFRTLEANYSESNNVLVVVTPRDGDVFTRDRLELIQVLTQAMWRAPYSIRVDSITNFQRARGTADEVTIGDLVPKDHALDPAEIEDIRAFALAEPLLSGLLIAADGRSAGININFQLPDDAPTAIDEIVDFLRSVSNKVEQTRPGIDVHMTGNVMIMSTFAEAGDLDLLTLVPIMCVVVSGLLFILLRSYAAVAIAMSLALLSTATALGVAGWLGIVLSAGSNPSPLIILTIALAYSVHVLTKFLDDYRTGWSKQEAIANAVEFNLSPIFLISATTAVGFLSLNLSEAPPFHDLGTIVSVGVIVTFVFSFSFVPAVLSVLPIKRPTREVFGTRAMKRLGRAVVIHRRALFWSMLLVIVGLGTGISRIELNDDWVRYFDDRFEFRRDTDAILRDLTGIDILEYSVPSAGPGKIFEGDYLEMVDEFSAWLRAQPEVVNVHAFTDILKRVNQSTHADDGAFHALPSSPQEAAQYLLLYEMSLPEGLDLRDRVTVDRSATRVTVTARGDDANLPSSELRALSDRISSQLIAQGVSEVASEGSGLSLMFAHLSERNIKSMLFGTGLALLAISGLILAALRDVKLGIASLVPNFVPAIMGFGLWGHAVGEIGVAGAVVAALAFGIVVDDTIHFFTKYLKGRRELGKSPEESIQYAFATVGKALTVTTLVLVCGFCILAASGFKVSSNLGLLTAATLAFALVADFLFLPALILMLDRNSARNVREDAERANNLAAVMRRLPSLESRMVQYYERVQDGHPVRGGTPGESAIELWSNDYLSVDGHASIVDAQVAALSAGRNDACLMADQLGVDGEHRKVERMMAEFIGADDAVICQSGWCANVGLIQTLADRETPIYIDIFAHASLWEGARLAGARTRPFRHNTPESLEEMITRYGPGIIAVDAIYSATGTICPLREIAEISARHDCVLVVDESHSLGAYGSLGEGLVPLLGLTDKVHYRTISLSKAFVTRAGLVAGPGRVMEYLRHNSRPAVHSFAIMGYEVERLRATMDVIKREGWRREVLKRNTDYLRFHLHNLGYGVEPTGSQVIAVPAGPERDAIRMRNAFEAENIFGAVFCYPATPKENSLIRLSVNCGLTGEDLDRVIQACSDVKSRASDWILKPNPSLGQQQPQEVPSVA